LVNNKLKFAQQQSLCNDLASQLPQGQELTPEEVLSQCNNEANLIAPAINRLAQSQCNNELQNQYAQNIPSSLVPTSLYPGHLKLCLILKLQSQSLLGQAANLANQLQNAKTPEEREGLQPQLSKCQNQAQQLQNQYNNQKSICLSLKGLQLIGQHLQNLNNQVANLLSPYNLTPT
jgi:hypothetical protein